MEGKDDFVVLKHKDFRFRQKIAGFDYDHTIVKPKSSSTFSKSIDDWIYIRENVKHIIKKMYQNGYSIVIFTNQSKKFKVEQIKNVLDLLEIPYKAYIMFNKEIKKPNPSMYFKHIENKKVSNQSFYAGDALGRENDWSDSDKIFAINCGLKYISPEEIFPFKQKKKIKINYEVGQELVILVGYPGSGKSTFAKNNFDKNNYVILSGDILKTEAKIVKSLKQNLNDGKSVVIDATNPSKKKRAVFIKIAKEKKLFVRVIHITTSLEESLLQNNNRDIKIPKIAFYVYRKNFEEPSKDEGNDENIKV